MASPTLASLITSLPKSQIFQKLLDICKVLGLDTESWQSGDPTRTTLDSISSRWAEWEDANKGFPAMIAGGLLGLAKGSWLTLLLAQNYNVTRREATYAASGGLSFTVTNTTSIDFGHFAIDDLTVQNPHTTTKPSYRNTIAFDLGPNATVHIDIEADVAGSGGNSDAGDIDTIVAPPMTGVTVSNTTAVSALDDENDDDATSRGQAKLEALSPAGPRGAYDYAIRTPELQADGSNQTNVTRTLVVEESDYGDALIFIAGASGALAGADVTKAQATIEASANPFVVNGEVLNSTNVVQDVTYELWVYSDINKTTAAIEAIVAAALAADYARIDIGGDKLTPGASGYLYVDRIKAVITEALAVATYDPTSGAVTSVKNFTFKVAVTTPAIDLPLAVTYDSVTPSNSTAQVPVLGAITPTAVHLVER